jgi:hypothetical protein
MRLKSKQKLKQALIAGPHTATATVLRVTLQVEQHSLTQPTLTRAIKAKVTRINNI